MPISSKTTSRFHAIVPAAGVGARLGAAVPKQYLRIGARTVLQWAIDVLRQASWLERIVVVVSPGDDRAGELSGELSGELAGADPRVVVARCGGATRRDSVRNGLQLLDGASGRDWVLVHDAARPGLTLQALEALRNGIVDANGAEDAVGGLLALPIADTVKRADALQPDRSAATLPRESLWQAQTPQMFRLALLSEALQRHPGATDEASAVEAMGKKPRLIVGSRQNFKVTTLEDLQLMRRLLTGDDGVAGGVAGDVAGGDAGAAGRDEGAAGRKDSGPDGDARGETRE